MNQGTRSRSAPLGASADVVSCKVMESAYWNEDDQRNEIVWGIQIQFSDDQTITIPDLCTQRHDVETFSQRLSGAALWPDSLPDIVDDYLGELYGLRMK